QCGKQARRLEAAAEAVTVPAVRRFTAHVGAEHVNTAARGYESADAVHQRRLSRAVRPDGPDQLPFGDLEGHVVDRANTAEADTDSLDGQPRCRDTGRGRARDARRNPLRDRRDGSLDA